MSKSIPSTKRAKLVELLSRAYGARLTILQKQLDWQPHTVRAEISRLRKTGLVVTCTPGSNGSVYKAQAQDVAREKTEA